MTLIRIESETLDWTRVREHRNRAHVRSVVVVPDNGLIIETEFEDPELEATRTIVASLLNDPNTKSIRIDLKDRV